MLRLVQFTKNNFAPINQIPPELLSLIPRYLDDDRRDKSLIAMTQVCRGWRDVLIRCSLLWTSLNCVDFDKTRVYIERSRSSPLEVSLNESKSPCYRMGPFLLVVPHIGRVDSLAVVGGASLLQNLMKYFSCPIPLLRNLTIRLDCGFPPALSAELFNSDLSSLCKLTLAGVIPHLPWQNIPKLTTFTLFDIPGEKISVARLLDFFTNAPLLNLIQLFSMPETSDAHPRRVVSLPCLKVLAISAGSAHSSILLNHLCIPTGALLHLGFDFTGEESPLPKVLPKTPENLQNALHITSACLRFGLTFFVRFKGPSGELHMNAPRSEWALSTSVVPDRRFLQSLDYFDLSRIQRLAVRTYEHPGLEEIDISPPSHILGITKDLRTLLLNKGNNLPFILALNPGKNASDRVLCSKLEDLIFYVDNRKSFNTPELMNMAKERASKGAKLRSILVASPVVFLCEEDVLKLKGYVVHVECRTQESEPEWDSIPGGGGD